MPVYKRLKMCSECPFRANALKGWLGPLTVDDLEQCVHGIRMGEAFVGDTGEMICHVHIDALYKKGCNETEVSDKGQQCVGMARYANSVIKESKNPEMKEFQERLKSVPDVPTIPPFKLREYHANQPTTETRRVATGASGKE